jgi:hypothetical protein
LLLVLASAVILRSEYPGTHDILLSQNRDYLNLEGQVPVFISLRDRMARLYPQALGSLFVASYDSQGYGGGIQNRLHSEDSYITPTVLFIITQYGPHIKHRSSVAFAFVGMPS